MPDRPRRPGRIRRALRALSSRPVDLHSAKLAEAEALRPPPYRPSNARRGDPYGLGAGTIAAESITADQIVVTTWDGRVVGGA